VRSHQYNPKGKPTSFGRLGWDAKSHAKWTHTAATFRETWTLLDIPHA